MSDEHSFQDFDPNGSRQADQTRYPGEAVNVLYDRRRCMHAQECGRASRAVFDGRRNPWIDPDQAALEELKQIVWRCPTGALQLESKDGQILEPAPPARNTIVVSPDGPLYIRGQVVVDEPQRRGRIQQQMALCRCGASRNKPYCDNTHVRLRFRDAGPVSADPGPDPGEGLLTVKVYDGGPLEVAGPVTLMSASGRPAKTDSPMWLCRCGNSKNRPFCDGSHTSEGFRSIDKD
ncbi:MAG: CDGSH iron-sulfur domain-containing protein [Myxococcota bacterium]